MANVDLAWLKRRRDELYGKFREFHRVRRDEWRPTIQRRKPINLPPDLEPYWSDWQSPMLELDRVTRTTILMLDQTKIDFVSWNESDDYKRDVEKARLWSTISQLKQNEGRWRDAYIGEGQIMDGVAIVRKHWRMPPEYGGSEKSEGESDWDHAARSMSEREKYYEAMESWPFWESGVDCLQCAWDGRDMEKPDIFMQEAEASYYEMQEHVVIPNGKWTLDEAGKVVILGPDEDPEQPDENTSAKKLRHLVCDYRDPKTGEWYCCEYLYPSDNWAQGEVVQAYKNPLGRCSYYVIPSAEIDRHQTDPHTRYRPMMYPLLTAVYAYNWLTSLIAALSMRALSDERIYLNAAKTPPELLSQLEGLGVRTEGGGAERRLTFEKPEAGIAEYAVLPGAMEQYPNNLIDGLVVLRDDLKEQIADFRSNRFLAGQVPDNVVANTTASTFSATTQAAGLPFGGELVMSDGFIHDDVLAEHHAIKVWDDGAEVDKPYYGVSPRAVEFLGGDSGLGGQAKPGDRVRLTASILRERKFDVNVQTRNQSQSERIQETNQAFVEYGQGTMDDLQLYRRLGYDDALAQREKMAKYYARATQAQRYEMFWAQQQDAFFEAVTGLNPGMAGEMQAQPGQGGGASAGGPNPPSPNLGVAPPPIQGPQGGNVGVEGGV